MPVAITLFYASVLAVLFLVLSVRVVLLRRRLRVGVGTGGQQTLELAVRAHANFSEYVPLALVMLLALEVGAGAPVWLLHLLGIMLVVGRVLHGLVGLNRGAGTSPGRFFGTLLTWLMLLVSAVTGLAVAFNGWLAA